MGYKVMQLQQQTYCHIQQGLIWVLKNGGKQNSIFYFFQTTWESNKICLLQTKGLPPLASSSILSMDRGPKVVRIMSATACHYQNAYGHETQNTNDLKKYPQVKHKNIFS